MAKHRAKRPLIRSSLSLGGLAAESDHLLSSAYYENGDYEIVSSRQDRRCILIGRTGSGKSAALAQLNAQFPEHVISVAPENLSLPYLADISVVRRLLGLGVHLESFFVALWKHIILVEIIKHRYRITTPEIKRNVL